MSVSWNGNGCSVLEGTEACHLFAADFRDGILFCPTQGVSSLYFTNDSCDSSFEGVENSYGTSKQGRMLTWGLASVLFIFVLVGLVRQTCRILGRLRCCHPLRGSVSGAKLKMKVRKWMSILFILVISIQMIVCQLFVNGGVHIRPDQLSIVSPLHKSL